MAVAVKQLGEIPLLHHLAAKQHQRALAEEAHGGQIVREILLYFNPQQGVQQSLILSIFTAALVAAFGLVKLNDYYIAAFFAFMAYESFIALQSLSRGGRW